MAHVFWEFREVWDGVAGQWARLAARLDGAGVPSLDDALRGLQLEPIHAPFRAIFADGLTVAVMDGVATTAQLDELERRFAAFLAAIAEGTGVDGDPAPIAAEMRRRAERAFVGMAVSAEDAGFAAAAAADAELDPDAATDPAQVHGLDRRDRAALLAWLALSGSGALAPGADVAATSLAWYDELRLPGALVAGLHDTGFGEGEAWAVTDQVRVLLALPRPSAMRGPARKAAARLLESWLDRRRPASRSASTPGRASSTSIAIGSRSCSRGRSVSTGSRRAWIRARRPRAPASRRTFPTRPRPPATGSIACGSGLARPRRNPGRRPSRSTCAPGRDPSGAKPNPAEKDPPKE